MSRAAKLQIGVLGAGQLALMLAEAARNLDIRIVCAGQPGDCASQVAEVLPVDLDDAVQVQRFAAQMDLITIESENIHVDVLQGLKVYPNAYAIGVAQDRLAEKEFFQKCGLSTAPYAAVNSVNDLLRAAETIGFPSILKTRRMGYDGKGQVRLSTERDASAAWSEVGGAPCILEGMVEFTTEVSLIAARGRTGEVVFYPLTENQHREGILRVSTAPFANAALQHRAEDHMRVVLEDLDYVGVLAIEFFVEHDGLIANEMAPRVHNSGHWTIEGSATSQFENHLRAISGMELGSTESRPTVMLNCIGWMPALQETAGYSGLHRHDYGKESRPGRKVGHLTFSADDQAAIETWKNRLKG